MWATWAHLCWNFCRWTRHQEEAALLELSWPSRLTAFWGSLTALVRTSVVCGDADSESDVKQQSKWSLSLYHLISCSLGIVAGAFWIYHHIRSNKASFIKGWLSKNVECTPAGEWQMTGKTTGTRRGMQMKQKTYRETAQAKYESNSFVQHNVLLFLIFLLLFFPVSPHVVETANKTFSSFKKLLDKGQSKPSVQLQMIKYSNVSWLNKVFSSHHKKADVPVMWQVRCTCLSHTLSLSLNPSVAVSLTHAVHTKLTPEVSVHHSTF